MRGSWDDVLLLRFDREAGALAVDRPLARLDGAPGYPFGFCASGSGREMSAARCTGYCGGMESPSEDAALHLWTSGDGGATWEFSRTTDVPGAGDAIRWDCGTPHWDPVRPPRPREAPRPALPAPNWLRADAGADGPVVWYWYDGDSAFRLIVQDEDGRGREAHLWMAPPHVLGGPRALVALGDDLLVSYGGYLVDLAARSVHPIVGWPAGVYEHVVPYQAILQATE